MEITNDSRKTLASNHCRILIMGGIINYKKLMDITGVSKATVFRLLKTFKNPRPVKNGRQTSLSSSNRQLLRLIAYKWPHLSNIQLSKKLEERGGPKVSIRTIGRALKTMDIQRKKPKPVPLLTDVHRQKRLAWCLRHRHQDWNNVVFSDESRFQYFSNSAKILCSRKKKPLAPRPGHSPALMVWGGIARRGVTPLAIITGTVDSLKYLLILEGYLIQEMRILYPEGYILQQDNAPPHVSRSTKNFFVDHGLEIMSDWPPNSPDLNPIENLWGLMKRKLAPRKRPPLNEWRLLIEKMWSSLDQDLIEKLIDSMPRRIEACIAANGGYTKY